jgi:uncharacterized membrane protein YesL
MRAFTVAFRALVSYYNELFLMLAASLLWWVTGGVFAGLALAMAWTALGITGQANLPLQDATNPFWLMPLLAIPAGPATAGLAYLARPVARDLHADRSMFFEGFRTYWKQALALSAIAMVVLALLLLNLFFYVSRESPFFQAFSLFWALLTVFWLSVGLYLYPVLVGLKEPGVVATLKTSVAVAFANPVFSLLLVVIAVLLSVVSVFVAILLLLAWPAVIALLGEHGLKLLVERVRGPEDLGEEDPRRQ